MPSWTEGAAAIIGAISGAVVATSPALYRFVTGRSKIVRAEYAFVVVHLKSEIVRLTGELQERTKQVIEINERLMTAEKHGGECRVETEMLKDKVEQLAKEVARLRKRR